MIVEFSKRPNCKRQVINESHRNSMIDINLTNKRQIPCYKNRKKTCYKAEKKTSDGICPGIVTVIGARYNRH